MVFCTSSNISFHEMFTQRNSGKLTSTTEKTCHGVYKSSLQIWVFDHFAGFALKGSTNRFQIHVFYKKNFYQKMSLKTPKTLKMFKKSPASDA